MESWSYISQGKGFLSDETISPPTPSTLARSKSAFLGWELKTSSSFGSDMLLPGAQQNRENQGYEQLSYPEVVGKQLPRNDHVSGLLNNQLGDAPGERVIGSVMAAANAFSNGEDSNSKLSNSIVESNGRDSLIDLKLGRFADQRDAKDLKFSEVAPAPILSSSSSSTPSKRARASGGHSQTAFCQVYGCNKDLSGSKDYHKRHKVCELHSKTAKVIVNGIEQRFCQQCSRFHLLAEFDDGKRSCRKRLAGHNERRRKPQVVVHSERAGRFLQSYNDNRFQGTSLTTASFICQDILPSRVLHTEKVPGGDWCRPVKTEANYSNLLPIPASNGQPHSRSFIPSFNSEKPFSFLQESIASTAAGNMFSDNNSQYTASLGVPNSGPRSSFHISSIESEDFNVFDTSSNGQGLSGILDHSGRALSLLSSQSQNNSGHSSGIPVAGSFVVQSSQSQYSVSQVSEKVTGMSSLTSTSGGVLNKFPSTEMNPADGHLGVFLISDCNDVVNFDVSDGILQETDLLNDKDHLTCKDGATIDLLKLSSQLQRVEHHRQTVHLKQENLQPKNQ